MAPLPDYHWCPGQFWDPGWGNNWDWGRCHDDFYFDGEPARPGSLARSGRLARRPDGGWDNGRGPGWDNGQARAARVGTTTAPVALAGMTTTAGEPVVTTDN